MCERERAAEKGHPRAPSVKSHVVAKDLAIAGARHVVVSSLGYSCEGERPIVHARTTDWTEE